MKEALGTLLDDARSDFDKARKNIEDWYEGTMDRVSGWYKRQVQVFLLVIGCATAAAINADSVNIGKALIRDPALRAAVVEAAEAELKNPTVPSPTPTPTMTPTLTPTPTTTPTASLGRTNAETPSPAATPTASPTPTPTPDAIKEIEKAGEDVRRTKARLDELGLPLSWAWAVCPDGKKAWACGDADPVNRAELRRVPGSVNEWALKLFGLFMTGLAISQGAPFWFDLLNKFMVIRSTVKPKEKSQEQPSKDRPAPETEVEDDAGGGKG